MKQKLLLFAFTLLSAMLFSQSLPSTPQIFEDFKTNDGTQNFFYKNVVQTDGSGNIYTLGATTTSNSTTDVLLSKKNSSGVTLWTVQINGTANYHDFGAGMVVISGNVYITGAITNNTTTLAPELFVRKYNSSGTLQFSSTYSGAGYGAVGKSIVVDGSGNSFIGGAEYNSSLSADMLAICFSSSGTQTWVNTYDYAGLHDGVVKIAIRSGKATITGPITISANNYKIATMSYSMTTGVMSETITTGSTITSSVEIISDMTTDASGNTYLCGAKEVSGQGYNMYLAKLTSSLTVAWEQTYNGTDNLNDAAKSIKVDGSGNVYVTGYSTSSTQAKEVRTIKYNSSGTLQWSNVENSTNNGNDEAFDMEIDASSNLYVVGSIASNINELDYYTVKYNSSGTKIFDIQSDGQHLNDQATNVALDSLNNVIVTGESETAPSTYVYTTYKYIQKDVITPTDFNGETTSEPFWYFQNQGQLRNVHDSLMSDVKYYTDKTNPGIFVLKNSMRFVMSRGDTVAATNDTIQSIKMIYNGASETAETYPLEKQNYSISYFQGTGRDFSDIHANAKLITTNLYPNIDLMYSSNQHGIKYYYIVKPGGDMRDIQIEFTGATSYSLNGTTNELSLNTLVGNIIFDRPTAYQLTSANATVAVTSFSPSWTTNGASNKYKFNYGTYTSSLTLVIEVDGGNTTSSAAAIGNLMWNTYVGGNWDDNNVDLKLDKWGNIYTLAFTNSANYYTSNTFQTIAPNINNIGTLIMKYNMYGKRRNQVYVGSNGNTTGQAITIVNDSNLVVVGSSAGSSLSGPTGGSNPSGAFYGTVGPSFIMKFDSTFTKIRWSTHYPGFVYDVDSKKNGHIYLCSIAYKNTGLVQNETGATNIPASAIISTHSGMVSKFNKNGVPLWSSYIGVKQLLPSYGAPMHIKIDTTYNEFYVFGKMWDQTDWRGYNSLSTFYQPSPFSTQLEPYIKKFDSNDSMIISTYYGGNRVDELNDAVMTKTGDVFFVGSTASTDTAHVTYNPYDGSYYSKKWDNTYSKGWVTKFDHNFNRKWATLYGDSMHTTAFNAVTIENQHGAVMIGGYTNGMSNVTFTGGYNKASDPSGDAAFLTFNAANQITWATSMGVQNLGEDGIYGVQFNPKDTNLVFAGGSDGNANYPWVQYPNSYWQNFNYAPGHNECNVGRFNASSLSMLVGIKELTNNSLMNADVILFPNPSNSFTNLYFKKGLENQVTINMYNALGQIIETRSYNNIKENTTLNFTTSHLTEGMYFINITSENSTKTLKFVTFK